MSNLLSAGLIIFIVGMLLEIHTLYYFSFFLILLYLVLKLYNYNIANRLEIIHGFSDDRIFLNETTNCKLQIENTGMIPIFWLKFRESLPVKLTTRLQQEVISLRPREKRTWDLQLKGKRRGYYQLGPLEWESGDILGYNIHNDRVEKSSYLVVYPKILTLPELGLPARLPYGEISWSQPIYQDPMQITGIREYQYGDSLKQIHWKATAKTGKIQVRKNESTITVETAIILNMSQEEYGLKQLQPRIELAVTTAASLANYLTNIKQSYSLITNGEDQLKDNTQPYINLPPGKGDEHLLKVLEFLARIEPSLDNDFISIFEQNLNLSWGTTVIIITNQDTEELIDQALDLKARGFSVKIILVGEQVLHRQYLHLPFTSSLSIYQVRKENDLYEL